MNECRQQRPRSRHRTTTKSGPIQMTINQITGSHAGGIKLTPGNYGDPLTITPTGTVAGSI